MFSVIMPAYNAEKFIEAAIESVLSQTFRDFELLIIDDCSEDHTVPIIKKYQARDSRVHLLHSECNDGVASARNKGIEAAQYPYICFLDSDDLWEATKLEKYYDYFQKGNDVLYSFYTRFNDKGSLNIVQAPLSVNYQQLLKGNCIGNLTGAYNAATLGKIFQKKVHHEDYLMWLEILQRTDQAVCIAENLAYYRVNDHSLSANKFKSMLWTWDIYRKELKLGIVYSSYFIVYYVVQSIIKRI